MSAAYGDRRRHDRFEIVGDLRATFGAEPLLRISNIGRGGAQVESGQPLPLMSTYEARLSAGGEEADVKVRVRHVRASDRDAAAFLVGVEFVGLSPAAAAIVERLMLASGGAAEM